MKSPFRPWGIVLKEPFASHSFMLTVPWCFVWFAALWNWYVDRIERNAPAADDPRMNELPPPAPRLDPGRHGFVSPPRSEISHATPRSDQFIEGATPSTPPPVSRFEGAGDTGSGVIIMWGLWPSHGIRR